MRGTTLSVALLIIPVLSGCIGTGPEDNLSTAAVDGLVDLPVQAVVDDWYDAPGVPNLRYHESPTGDDAPFHTLEEIEAKIAGWAEAHPDLVRVEVIGYSREERPIWDVIVTDTSVEGPKLTPFIDGGHHANELGGIELALFTVDFLLENHGSNATIQRLLDTLEIHVVPLVNPDGYVRQTRGNALGVNLNRNYDIDWGNPGGASNLLMGTVAHATGAAMPSVPIVAENCGPEAFSEPESRAMRDLMERLAPTTPFYLTGHTPTHAVIGPWAAFEPPFEMPPEHRAVIESELEWIRTATEYEAGKAEWGNFSAGLPYSASGTSMDYFYMIAQKPAFTIEVEFWYTSTTSDNWPDRALGMYEGLRYWMDASLPVSMHMLMNAERLGNWELPDEPTLVPDGSVPDPPDRTGVSAPPPVMH